MTDSASGEALAEVARFDTSEEARRAAETLVLRGVGAVTEPRDGPEAGFALLVVPEVAPQAAEILGLSPKAVTDLESPRPPRPQLLYVLAVFGAALILLPLLAFFVSFKLSGG
jgi:hypothetical protein